MKRNGKKIILDIIFTSLLLTASSCQQVTNLTRPIEVIPSSLRDVPAQRLGFRFEADVQAPLEAEQASLNQPEKLTAIQADFDQNRLQDSLERTISSPNKQSILAIYQNSADEKQEFRLDLYDAAGKFIRKVAPEKIALVFPDSVAWSPDNTSFAFIGLQRSHPAANEEIVQEAPRPPDLENTNSLETNSNPTPLAEPSLPPPAILFFHTEQIYLANSDGNELKSLTQNESLIYFKFFWAPDGTQLAALACKENEWQVLQARAAKAGETFKPSGRPRVIDKSGRERRFDDNLTNVDPVWSPNSSKIAAAFDKQIRIYDAIGNNPTAASIPLQIPLLIAAKICDDKVAANQSCLNNTSTITGEQNNNVSANLPTTEPTTFVPIISLNWEADKTLYFETGFVKDFSNGEQIRSYLRWHRLNFSPQAITIK